MIDDRAVVVIDFVTGGTFFGKPGGQARYTFTRLRAGAETLETGSGMVMEDYSKSDPGSSLMTLGPNHQPWIKADPFEVKWSIRDAGSGYVNWKPENLWVVVVSRTPQGAVSPRRFLREAVVPTR